MFGEQGGSDRISRNPLSEDELRDDALDAAAMEFGTD